MNRALVDPIADAVLYEGYILYPYRPSVKNRQRWTFGGLYPEPYCRSQGEGDSPGNQTECLVLGTPATSFEAAVRFLHLTARRVGEFAPPLTGWPDGAEPPFRPVETLRVGEKLFHTWQEAEEREVGLGEAALGELSARPQVRPFAFEGGRRSEPLRGTGGEVVGVLVREQRGVEGVVERSAVEVGEGLYRLTLRVVNRTPWEGAGRGSRDEALLRSLVSTHAVLGLRGGEFVSLLDPPGRWRDAAAACRNVGTWPVLVGEEGRKDTMLSSPIILYDYPRVAPESPGDFFDGTEIDEMLALRVLTMTDEEKTSMAAVDERAGALLARVEGLAREELLALHGTVRGLRPVPEGGDHG
jgi:hydrogenase maturation protease